jgi:hypothetical protein
LRLAAEFQFRRAAVRAVGGNGDGGQIVFSIRQRKAETERAVGTQFDFVAAERDFRVRLGRAVNDQLGIDVEPKTFRFRVRPPPNGLVGLLARPGLEMPNAVTGEVTSCARRRRMSSVISSEPIQTRRVSSMLMILASAFSCSGVQCRVGPVARRTGDRWME